MAINATKRLPKIIYQQGLLRRGDAVYLMHMAKPFMFENYQKYYLTEVYVTNMADAFMFHNYYNFNQFEYKYRIWHQAIKYFCDI